MTKNLPDNQLPDQSATQSMTSASAAAQAAMSFATLGFGNLLGVAIAGALVCYDFEFDAVTENRSAALPDFKTVESLYNQLPNRSLLLDWNDLNVTHKFWVRERILDATASVAPVAEQTAPVNEPEQLEILRRIATLLEQFLQVLGKPPAGPPPMEGDEGREWDDEEELRQIWLQLSPEQRAILRFIRKAGDKVITYSLIAVNITVPRLPGDDREEWMSDKSVAKYCRPMEWPPLSLLQRLGTRSTILLTSKGYRLLQFVSQKDFL